MVCVRFAVGICRTNAIHPPSLFCTPGSTQHMPLGLVWFFLCCFVCFVCIFFFTVHFGFLIHLKRNGIHPWHLFKLKIATQRGFSDSSGHSPSLPPEVTLTRVFARPRTLHFGVLNSSLAPYCLWILENDSPDSWISWRYEHQPTNYHSIANRT